MLYPDLRVGGNPRFILADEPPNLMLIPDEVRKCVAYIGYRKPTGEMSLQGTAFFVGRPIEGTDKSFCYIVTAKHVIQGIGSKTPNGQVILRVNFTDGNAYTISTELDKWHFHPEETEVDVAVYPHALLDNGADVSLIPFSMFLDEATKDITEFGIGEDVYLTGLFHNHHGKKRNIPIVRMGNIVALPEEKVLTPMGFIDAYLVEARSIGGISGSPVFVNFGTTRWIRDKFMTATNKYGSSYLLGIMHGHYKKDKVEDGSKIDEINLGIAIVVPVEKILEVINQPMIKEQEEKFEREILEDVMPTLDSIDEDIDITQESFEDSLKKASRKLSLPEKETKETSE